MKLEKNPYQINTDQMQQGTSGSHESHALLTIYQMGKSYAATPLIPQRKPDYLDQVHQLPTFTPSLSYIGRSESKANAQYTTSYTKGRDSYSSGLAGLLNLGSSSVSYTSRGSYNIN